MSSNSGATSPGSQPAAATAETAGRAASAAGAGGVRASGGRTLRAIERTAGLTPAHMERMRSP